MTSKFKTFRTMDTTHRMGEKHFKLSVSYGTWNTLMYSKIHLKKNTLESGEVI